LRTALAELFQETMAPPQNGLDEVTLRPGWHGFNRRQTGTGMGDVRAK
jgi:hypothetical protein